MVRNKIRKVLLGLILALVVVSLVSLVKSLNKEALPLETLKMMSKSIDVQIENFSLTHEALGKKEWEIKAKKAQVKNEENKIFLTDVEVTLNTDKNRRTTISADSGTIDQKTKDIQLEGHVKFRADANNFFEQFQKPSDAPEATDNP